MVNGSYRIVRLHLGELASEELKMIIDLAEQWHSTKLNLEAAPSNIPGGTAKEKIRQRYTPTGLFGNRPGVSLFDSSQLDVLMGVIETLNERDIEALMDRMEDFREKAWPEEPSEAYPDAVRWVDDTIGADKPIGNQPTISGYVYLLRGVEGYYKIGKALNPEVRIRKLGVVLPFPIVTEHLIPCKDHSEAEKSLHKKYKHRRKHGEWFALSADDVESIKAITEL